MDFSLACPQAGGRGKERHVRCRDRDRGFRLIPGAGSSFFATDKGLQPLVYGAGVIALLLWGIAFASQGESYRVEFQGIQNDKLLSVLKSASDLVALENRPPAARALLERRVDRDRASLLEALEAQGYYDSTVTPEIDWNAKPVHVILHIDAGPQYKMTTVDVASIGETAGANVAMPAAADLGLTAEQPVKAEIVAEAEKKLIRLLRKQGFPYALVTKRTAKPDRETKTAALTYYVDIGRQCRFGPTIITGLQSVRETAIRPKIPWREGDVFNGDLVDKLKKRLFASGLFSLVDVSLAAKPDADGLVTMTVKVTERKYRTISAGANYATDEGIGGNVAWENRNLRGLGDRLALSGRASEITYDVSGNYTIPDFLRAGQSLILKSRIAQDRPDAFMSRSVGVSAALERNVSDVTKAGAGLAFRTGRVNQAGESDSFTLFSIPAYMNRERLNDPLDPIKGERLNLRLTPFVDLMGSGGVFAKAEAG